MGIFNQWFSRREKGTSVSLDWQVLENTDQWEGLLKESYKTPQLIFKHSTTCGLSGMVLRRFEQSQIASGQQGSYHLLDIHAHRGLSDLIARDLETRHESPQALLISEGRLLKKASHSAILASSWELKNPAK